MKLYYSPGACSLAAHIALRELALEAELVRVDLGTKRIVPTGEDFFAVNPMGQVPALELDDGTVLTEGAAVLQYVADLAPGSGLAPAAGTPARYRLASLLNLVSTELHKAFAPLFDPMTPAEYRAMALADMRAMEVIARILERSPYLMGERFTVVDAYLYAVLRLGEHIGIEASRWPAVAGFMRRVGGRPAVHEAMQAEELVEG